MAVGMEGQKDVRSRAWGGQEECICKAELGRALSTISQNPWLEVPIKSGGFTLLLLMLASRCKPPGLWESYE